MKMIPFQGNFLREDKDYIFKGEVKTYNNENYNAVGHLIYNEKFNEGIIKAKIKFEAIEFNCGCEIMLAYQQNDRSVNMLTAGIQKGNYAYVIKYFDGKKWTEYGLTGDGKNIIENEIYNLEVRVLGSEVTLLIDDLEVLNATIPFAIEQNKVGLYCQSNSDIRIIDFNVEHKTPKVFVVMQFSSPFNEIYSEVIKEICEKNDVEVIRADENYSTGMIISDITRDINNSKFIIADITQTNYEKDGEDYASYNPNVFYEVGYAHALNKPTILLAEKNSRLPFDVSGFRVLFYQNTISGKKKMQEGLANYLSQILQKEIII